MNSPELSIVLSAYNEESYLRDCLDSILQQEYSNWELLASDDFSNDRTKDILEEYALKDDRIKYLQHPKKGLINALSFLENQASGKYISRMDADDMMPLGKLSSLMNRIRSLGPGHIVTGKVEYFSSGKELQDGYLKYEKWLNWLVDESKHWSNLYKECVVASPNWIILKEDLIACGGVAQSYPEDYDLCFRWYQKGYKIVGIDEITHLWRDHLDRTSRVSSTYSDNRFLELKARYFSKLEAQKFESVYLWGVGKKGKQLAKLFNVLQMSFIWISENKKKVGHAISDHIIQDSSTIIFQPGSCLIVATTQDREYILKVCEEKDVFPYIFC